VILDLTVHYGDTVEYTETACDVYEWHGQEFRTSGVYTYDTLTVHGCDSLEILHLTINYGDTVEYTETACDRYEWYDKVYTKSGDYEHMLQTVHGCDSLAILHLTVHYSTDTTFYETVCDSYTWLQTGKTYTKSGLYYDSLQTVYGCDSVVILDLTILQPTEGEPQVEYVCHGETFTWNGVTYDASGKYITTLTNAVGCDSIAHLHLTILPEMVTTEHEDITCPSMPYSWFGQELTMAGTYYHREQFTVNSDCDSVEHILTLKLYDLSLPTTVTDPIAICGKPVDTSVPTSEIESYIAGIADYAPNFEVIWQVKKETTWTALAQEPLTGEPNVVVRYVIQSDCDTVESAAMILPIESPTPENSPEFDNFSLINKYNNRIFLFDMNTFKEVYHWEPEPHQVVWYKVVGELDPSDRHVDDQELGKGHSFSIPNGEVMEGTYYAKVLKDATTGTDDCERIYRSELIAATGSTVGPKLVPNVVHPNETLTVKDLDASQIHEILVFSTTGELIATYKAEKVSEFIFQANHSLGYYLVDIINDNGSTTLRYVVK
jgi:hypothetical protein